jgi:spore maturation protein CgeB
MKLVVLGLSITSSWGNGHATTYRGLCRALAVRGHRVVFLEWDAPWYGGAHRDLPPQACDYASILLFGRWADGRALLRRELADADAVLLGSYFPQGVEAASLLAQEYAGPRLYYDIDTPITVRALREQGGAEYLRADQVPIFDVYLSFTGGPVLRELEETLGAPRAVPFYCSVDPERHAPVAARREYRCDLGYMGTWAADRQPELEALLCEPARRAPRRSFIVAGPQYPPELDWPANVRRFEHLPPAEHAAFYSSGRLTLNLTRAEMRRSGWSPSVRLFEAAACGAAILSDRWQGLDSVLAPGTEILLADTPADTEAALSRSDTELRRIGEAARARVLAEHTNAARAAVFEAEVRRAAETRRSAPPRPLDTPGRPSYIGRPEVRVEPGGQR